MVTIDTVKAQIQSLIDSANIATGNTDTNLTDAVNALVSGYGDTGTAKMFDTINIYQPKRLQINEQIEIGTDSLTIEKAV